MGPAKEVLEAGEGREEAGPGFDRKGRRGGRGGGELNFNYKVNKL